MIIDPSESQNALSLPSLVSRNVSSVHSDTVKSILCSPGWSFKKLVAVKAVLSEAGTQGDRPSHYLQPTVDTSRSRAHSASFIASILS